MATIGSVVVRYEVAHKPEFYHVHPMFYMVMAVTAGVATLHALCRTTETRSGPNHWDQDRYNEVPDMNVFNAAYPPLECPVDQCILYDEKRAYSSSDFIYIPFKI
jgi:hypothetical protein